MQVWRTSTFTGKGLLPLASLLPLTGVGKQAPCARRGLLAPSGLARPSPEACRRWFWYNTSMEKCFESVLWPEKGCFRIPYEPFLPSRQASFPSGAARWSLFFYFFPEISALPAEQKKKKRLKFRPAASSALGCGALI